MSGNTRYVIRQSGKPVHGPFTRADMRRLAQDGKLKRTDKIAVAGTERWISAGEARGLFAQDAIDPPEQLNAYDLSIDDQSDGSIVPIESDAAENSQQSDLSASFSQYITTPLGWTACFLGLVLPVAGFTALSASIFLSPEGISDRWAELLAALGVLGFIAALPCAIIVTRRGVIGRRRASLGGAPIHSRASWIPLAVAILFVGVLASLGTMLYNQSDHSRRNRDARTVIQDLRSATERQIGQANAIDALRTVDELTGYVQTHQDVERIDLKSLRAWLETTRASLVQDLYLERLSELEKLVGAAPVDDSQIEEEAIAGLEEMERVQRSEIDRHFQTEAGMTALRVVRDGNESWPHQWLDEQQQHNFALLLERSALDNSYASMATLQRRIQSLSREYVAFSGRFVEVNQAGLLDSAAIHSLGALQRTMLVSSDMNADWVKALIQIIGGQSAPFFIDPLPELGSMKASIREARHKEWERDVSNAIAEAKKEGDLFDEDTQRAITNRIAEVEAEFEQRQAVYVEVTDDVPEDEIEPGPGFFAKNRLSFKYDPDLQLTSKLDGEVLVIALSPSDNSNLSFAIVSHESSESFAGIEAVGKASVLDNLRKRGDSEPGESSIPVRRRIAGVERFGTRFWAERTGESTVDVELFTFTLNESVIYIVLVYDESTSEQTDTYFSMIADSIRVR